MSRSEDEIVQVPEVKYPAMCARLWHGMTTFQYLRLLARKNFRVSLRRWAMAFLITIVSLFNLVLAGLQSLIFGRRIDATKLETPPIFVVGHWRSGTTLLHELLSLDERHTFPTTYECFAPQHFLLTTWLFPKLLWFAMPQKRPMDSMAVGFDTPQEDEFALVSMGSPSTYFRLAFPNDDPPYEDLYNMQHASAELKAKFDRDLTYFFKALTLARKKRLILKSPTHTGRIEHLAKLFPGAKFIHISRHPFKQFSSTMQMWMIMDHIQGFQLPRYTQLQMMDYCLRTFGKMYDDGYLKQVDSLPESDRIEIRFEDLVKSPQEQIRSIYEHFGWDGIDGVCDGVERYFADRKNYKKNKHELSSEVKAQIAATCASYMNRYGYESPNSEQ